MKNALKNSECVVVEELDWAAEPEELDDDIKTLKAMGVEVDCQIPTLENPTPTGWPILTLTAKGEDVIKKMNEYLNQVYYGKNQ